MSIGPKRPLTPEEKKLWRLVTQNARPLRGAKNPAEENEIPPHQEEAGKKADDGISFDKRPFPDLSSKKKTGSGRKLAQGVYAGIDRNTAERFRKGNAAIDAILDLHGMTREKARRTLQVFIRSHYGSGSRCLLVITGKGTRGESGEVRGVLRELLPQWLTEDELRPMILALDRAQPKHGGSGAYYVLLRRKR